MLILVETEDVFFLSFPFTEGKITHSWSAARQKYLLLIDWGRHFYILVGFFVFYFCSNNEFFQVLLSWTF